MNDNERAIWTVFGVFFFGAVAILAFFLGVVIYLVA